MGDDLTASREVEHFAYFSRRRRAEAAGDELVAAGFAVELGRRGLKTVLKATRLQALGDPEVTAFTSEVITIVERNAGDYDGWGAMVEEPERT